MKLFQIEEPDGAPQAGEGPGAAVGIDIGAEDGAVAVAVGGNAELLPGADGARRLAAAQPLLRQGRFDEAALTALLLGLRGQAEKQLQRPVTHAVLAIEPLDEAARATVAAAAAAAGLDLLRLLTRREAAALAGAAAGEAAALGAAVAAEELAPPAG